MIAVISRAFVMNINDVPFCRRDLENQRSELLARDFRIAYSTLRGLGGFTQWVFALGKPAIYRLGIFPQKSVLQGI